MSLLVPTDGLVLRENATLAPGVYFLPHGLSIASNGITLDGNGAVLVGSERQGAGIRLQGRKGVVIRNVRLRDYYHGIHARDCEGLTIAGTGISSTAEIAPNTVFLDIWLGPEQAYGGGILLWACRDCVVEDNDLQHQQSGLLTYFCGGLQVRRNQANYNSGFGFHLYGTCDSLFEANSADYCCRFEPREGGLHYGHMGADAAGFLAVRGSSRNTFRRNAARLGGDGFFLAGLAPDGTRCGCDENLFEENDGGLSPNIAFEATFCRANVFRKNRAERSNYGFWLGYSWDTIVEENRMVMNRQAGIATEHGRAIAVRRNEFQANGHGILLWSCPNPQLSEWFPESPTSLDWRIEENVMTRNGKGIRIAADQDHGIRPIAPERAGRPEARPRNHILTGNDIQDNRVGIELHRADRTTIEGNILNRNVEADLREEDCSDTVARNNLGAAGGYL